jgi:hypothetical protein
MLYIMRLDRPFAWTNVPTQASPNADIPVGKSYRIIAGSRRTGDDSCWSLQSSWAREVPLSGGERGVMFGQSHGPQMVRAVDHGCIDKIAPTLFCKRS